MNLEIELKKLIEDYFDFEVKEIEKNLESTVGNVYMVCSNSNKYIIKIYSDIEHTKAMINLHKILNDNNFYVPKIISNKLNEDYTKLFTDKYIVIYSFLEGHQIVWDTNKIKLTDKEIDTIAKTLRRMHKTTNNNEIGLPKLKFGLDIKRQSILHFDLTRNNIFIDDKKRRIGFIDFDDAKFGACVCDVSILIANLFFSKSKGANLEGMRRFTDAYYLNDLQMKEEEVPKIKECALMWIDYVLDGNEFDSSTIESFEARRYLIKKYLYEEFI